MTVQDWAAFALSITSLVGAFAIMIRWMVKHYLAELKPNGGSSLKDSVNVNTERLNRVEQRVDDIYKLLCEKQ
jgi:hypothetical protein